MLNGSVLITGASGMLGQHVVSALSNYPNLKVSSVGRASLQHSDHYICDIANTADFDKLVNNLKPSYVIHCAANINVDECESKKEETFNLHVGTAEVIASKSFIKKSIYVSTDSVFDGIRGDYKENDGKNPLNYYAITKSLAEEKFLSSAHHSVVIRTNIIGYSSCMKQSLFEWAFKALSKGEEVKGFTNVIFNPLYVKTLAEILVFSVLFKDIEKGVYHFGSSDYNSKYEFLRMVARVFGFDSNLIKPIEAAAMQLGTIRPLNTTLNVTSSEQKLGINFPKLNDEVKSIFHDIKL